MRLLMSDNVRLNGMKVETSVVLAVASAVANRSLSDWIVTSLKDGEHSEKSLHYIGHALDMAPIGEVTAGELDSVEVDLSRCLSKEFDIVRHYDGERFTHFHIEFQPKLSSRGRIHV